MLFFQCASGLPAAADGIATLKNEAEDWPGYSMCPLKK